MDSPQTPAGENVSKMFLVLVRFDDNNNNTILINYYFSTRICFTGALYSYVKTYASTITFISRHFHVIGNFSN